jgi:hypothetical protein
MESFVTTPPKFAYRRNPDASIDSICLCCYRTAARAVIASELSRLEVEHHCEIDPLTAAGRDRFSASAKAKDATSC